MSTDQAIAKATRALLASGARRALLFVNAKETVSVSRRVYRIRGRKPHFGARGIDLVVTIGKPNYQSRAFLKKCRVAGEPLPVKKVQLQFLTGR